MKIIETAWYCGIDTLTRNSSGDEIANVNFLYDASYTHYKIQ